MDNPKYIQVMRQVASDFDGTMLKECISEYKRGKGRLTTGKYPTDPVA